MRNSPRGFGHIAIYKPVTEHHIICFDPERARMKTELRELVVPVKQRMAEMSNHFSILHYVAEADDKSNWTFCIPTCVSVSKYILGINSKAWTPYELYIDLIKNGALLVTD